MQEKASGTTSLTQICELLEKFKACIMAGCVGSFYVESGVDGARHCILRIRDSPVKVEKKKKKKKRKTPSRIRRDNLRKEAFLRKRSLPPPANPEVAPTSSQCSHSANSCQEESSDVAGVIQDTAGVPRSKPDLSSDEYNTEKESDISDLDSDDSKLNIDPTIAKQMDTAVARALSPGYPYGNQAMFRAEHVEMESNQLLTVKLKGNNRTFFISEEVMGSDIGVCECHGPRGVGGLVQLPHYRGDRARERCSKSVKLVFKKCDMKKNIYYLDECIEEILPLDFVSAKMCLRVYPIW